jgi:toxin ParE1/3/4
MILTWTPSALDDLEKIIDYVAYQNVNAAVELQDSITEKIDLIASNNLIGRIGRAKGTREFVVHPHYVVVYDIVSQIRILRILHTSQQWEG